MGDSHETIVDNLIEIEYGTTAGPITDTALLKCQKEIAKQGGKYADCRLKNVQKCRNDLNKGKLTGFAPENCATADAKTAEKIQKCDDKARAAIPGKCTSNEMIQALDVCNPPATTPQEAANCIIQTHSDMIDNPEETAPPDLIDYEYATAAICGDNIVDTLDEECDGTDDAACVGQCGARDGLFACLCLNKKRMRAFKHANADLDDGWTGQAHDQGIVEGGGYLVDLYDCDCPGGTDPLCIVGPSCNISKAACKNNADCPTPSDFCRKERTAAGPRCYLDHMVPCTSDAQCQGAGDFCAKQFHGQPLPIAAGAVSVCVVNEFSEDLVGTVNLDTGDSEIRLHQDAKTHLEGNIPQPCPVCGFWCNDSVRRNCTTNADCDAGVACVTERLCSRGPNKDKACRPDPPTGGASTLFGTTSRDCPPQPANRIATLDVLYGPATTGTTTKLPAFACNHPGFNFTTCLGGTNEGARCADNSECPGGVCSEQCFCLAVGGTQEAPNQCEAACVSAGGDDGDFCIDDSNCPTGFCHAGDCRDSGLNHEGVCTSGPIDQKCEAHKFRGCVSNADCERPTCPYCLPEGEACLAKARECFVNSGIIRTGVADALHPVEVSTFCLGGTSNSATNTTAGLPGGGALRSPQTRYYTGLDCP